MLDYKNGVIMCGIFGKVIKNAIIDKAIFKKQLSLLNHRGPDNLSCWFSEDQHIGLGHTRLSIVDLTSVANQPMKDESQNIILTFNGEIYNFKSLRQELLQLGYNFKTDSDTEVLLNSYKAWGKNCLNKINGMFAIALFDKPQNIILLARDRAGEKPLYYFKNQDSISFASEIKALLESPDCLHKLSLDALQSYLYFNCIQGKQSIISDIYKLLPGHYLIINLNNFSIETNQYWKLPDYCDNDKSLNLLLNDFDKLIHNSIEKQLVADVPIGVLLSGGLDSSIITAIASEYKKDLNTFTIKFSSHEKLDESSHAKLIANYFKTNHIELDASTVEPDILENLVYYYDEPFSDASMIPTYILCKLVKKHCKVVLGGDGGDELFGGYSNYQRYLNIKGKLQYLPLFIRKTIATFFETLLPLGTRGLASISLLKYDFNKEIPIYSQFNPNNINELLPDYFYPQNTNAYNAISANQEINLINRLTRTDFLNYLPDDILVKVDRASMANSLEMRAPMLDKSIIEFAFRDVKAEYKVTNQNKKIFLKEYAKRILPKEFDFQRKQGFEVPFEAWYKESKWQSYFKDILTSKECIFDPKAIQKILQPTKIPVLRSNIIFSLAMFEIWRRKYSISL